jgi:hypothetical protein
MTLENQPHDSPESEDDPSQRPRVVVNRDRSSPAREPAAQAPLKTKGSAGRKVAKQQARPRGITTNRIKNEWRWWLFSFLVGALVGCPLALFYGWVINPRPAPVSPAELLAADKAFYVRLIALALAHEGDASRAQARLATLAEPNIGVVVARLTEDYIADEQDVRDITALVKLSQSVGQVSPVMLAFIATATPRPTFTPTPSPTSTPEPTASPTASPTITPRTRRTSTPSRSPTMTRSPTPSRTPTVTQTPTPGPNAPFGVAQSVPLCDNSGKGGLLRIYVRDRLGDGVPGVEVSVIWPGGRDTFFTGFKPEFDPGYADFQMVPGERYQIELTGVELSGQPPEINLDNRGLCPRLADEVNPSWQVVFEQGVN